MEAFRLNFTSGVGLALLRKLDREDFELTIAQAIIWFLVVFLAAVANDAVLSLVANTTTTPDVVATLAYMGGFALACLVVALVQREGEAFAALMVVTAAISPPIFLASFCLELAMAWSVSGMGDIAELPNQVAAVAWMALAAIFFLLAGWLILVLYRAIRCALDVGEGRAALHLILYLVACFLPVYFVAAT